MVIRTKMNHDILLTCDWIRGRVLPFPAPFNWTAGLCKILGVWLGHGLPQKNWLEVLKNVVAVVMKEALFKGQGWGMCFIHLPPCSLSTSSPVYQSISILKDSHDVSENLLPSSCCSFPCEHILYHIESCLFQVKDVFVFCCFFKYLFWTRGLVFSLCSVRPYLLFYLNFNTFLKKFSACSTHV